LVGLREARGMEGSYTLKSVQPRKQQVESIQVNKIKEAAHQLIDQLPDNSTWDDVIYGIELRREIEEGLADSDAGRTTPSDEVRKEFGLKK